MFCDPGTTWQESLSHDLLEAQVPRMGTQFHPKRIIHVSPCNILPGQDCDETSVFPHVPSIAAFQFKFLPRDPAEAITVSLTMDTKPQSNAYQV